MLFHTCVQVMMYSMTHVQVINAGCADKDLSYLRSKMADFKGDVHLTVQWDNRGLYALQV